MNAQHTSSSMAMKRINAQFIMMMKVAKQVKKKNILVI